MSKKQNAIEVLTPVGSAPDIRAELEALIERKIAEAMGGPDAIFQPFFQSKAVAQAIRKLETVPQQLKWHAYFQRWGCLICRQKKRPHYTLGMCEHCYRTTAGRLRAVLRLAEEERKDGAASFTPDRMELARAAVRKQAMAPAPALPPESRPLVLDLADAACRALRSELEKIERADVDGETLRSELRKILLA